MLFFQTFLRNTHAFDYSEEKTLHVIRKPAGWSDSNQNHGYYCEMRNSIRRDFRPFYPERKLKSLRWLTTTPTFLIMPFQQQYTVQEMKPWPIKLTGEKEYFGDSRMVTTPDNLTMQASRMDWPLWNRWKAGYDTYRVEETVRYIKYISNSKRFYVIGK